MSPTASESDNYLKLRKSKPDSIEVAEYLDSVVGVDPWSVDQVSDLIDAAHRSGDSELPIEKRGRTPVTKKSDVCDWFERNIQSSTIKLDLNDYRRSQAFSFYDILVSGLDATDMGSGGRQRTFGQHLENAIGGYLAEVAVAKFLEKNGIEEAFLDLGRIANLHEAKGSDIVAIRDDSELREPNLKIQVKKSKPRSMWLPIGSKDESEADVFVLARVGLPYEHMAQYLQEIDVLSDTLDKVSDQKREEIIDEIPEFDLVPVHISGFAYWEEFDNGDLHITEKQVNSVIDGGIGEIPEKPPKNHSTERIKVEKLGNPSENYLAAISALHTDADEWATLFDNL